MTTPADVFLHAAADQAAKQALDDLMRVAATYDGIDANVAALDFANGLDQGETTRHGLASAVALLALRAHRAGAE